MPLPYDPVFDAIQTFLGTQSASTGAWDFTVAPLVYENEGDGPPTGDVSNWVQVTLESDLYGQQSIGGGQGQGGNRWDEEGSLWFHIFVPRGTQSREARRIAKGLANLFRGRLLLNDSLEFLDAHMAAGDPGEENANYYLMSVNIDWRYSDAQ